MSVTARAAVLALLTGCAQPQARSRLPDQLVTVVGLARGGYASAVVDMHQPANRARVRVAPGVVAVGPRGARSVSLAAEVQEGGGGWEHLVVTDLLDGGRVEQRLTRPVELMGLRRGVLTFEAGGVAVALDLASGEATTLARPPAPVLRLDRDGPGQGFHMRLEGDRVELLRPRGDPDQWELVLSGVSRVVSAEWLRRGDLPAAVQGLVDLEFKAMDVIVPGEGAAVIDGDLGEWDAEDALPVQGDASVLHGREYWAGPRDGAFGVSARVDGERLSLGVRVRDDAVLAGRDELLIQTADRLIQVPLARVVGAMSGEGWEAAVRPVDWGVACEISLEGRPGQWAERPLQVIVSLDDQDPGQGTTTLSTAQSLAMLSLGGES